MTPPSQPTPGPWHVDDHAQETNTYRGPIVRSEKGMRIACLMGSNDVPGAGYRDSAANARLIAEAPTMLVILRETLVALPNHTADCPMGPGPIRIQPSGAACCLFSETHANGRALLARIDGKETP